MHTYLVKEGASCKLLTQSPDTDIKVEDFVTRKPQEFGGENIVIDYIRFKNSKQPVNSVATRLASRGYYIFCHESVNDKYLMAIPSHLVEVEYDG